MRDDILVPIFCLVDDFCKEFDPLWKKHLLANAPFEHHRHRSPWNFLIDLLGGLAAYCQDSQKPTLRAADEARALIYRLAA